MERTYKKIIISRPDSIGDVILTLPLCGYLKGLYPDTEIIFIGKKYTRTVVQMCKFVDHFIAWDEVQLGGTGMRALSNLRADVIIHAFPDKEIVKTAFQAKIPIRIASARRFYTLPYCNKRVWFSRKKSTLHESQLNFKLLRGLGIEVTPELKEIPALYGFKNPQPLDNKLQEVLDKSKKQIVLHPKSKGSAVEWPISKFNELINLLDSNKYQVLITGTEGEGKLIRNHLLMNDNVIDLTGKMSLDQFITFLSRVDVVIAGSTGPLHIASALGTAVIGLYSPAKPIHPGRWQAVGLKAYYLENKEAILEGNLRIPAPDVFQKIEEVMDSPV